MTKLTRECCSAGEVRSSHRRAAAVCQRCAAVILCAALAACGGGTDEGPTGSEGSIAISVSPQSLVLFAGGSVTATVTITRVNYTGVVTLDIAVPAGVTASFNPPSLNGSMVSSTLTLTAAADAPFGAIPLHVGAAGTDITAAVQVSLQLGRPALTVARSGTGTGTVTSAPAGINCGTACKASFPFGTNVTLTATPAEGSAFATWFGGGCTGTTPACSVTVTSAPTITATFNSTAQSFSLGLGLGTANVQQGGMATATATITRNNGFAGTVSLAFSGTPSGLTIGANPVGPTDNAATITIAAASALAAGNYPATVTATAPGVANQTGTLNVQVNPAPGGSGNIALSFAGCDPSEVPVWVAAQSGAGPWTRVTMGPNNTFTFATGATGGVAIVRHTGPGFSTSVFYGSRDDITTLALGRMCTGIVGSVGTLQLSGSVAGNAANLATISVGGAYTEFPPQQGLTFVLNDVPAGRRDLIATATNVNAMNGNRGIARMILRRDVTYAGTIPQLDFNGPEYFVPVSRLVTTNNLGGDQSSAEVSLHTLNGASASYLRRLGGPAGVAYAGVPDSLVQPGDLHTIQVVAAPATSPSGRVAIMIHHSAVEDAVDFGPPLNQPAVTSLGGSPSLRQRAQLTSQAAYGGAATADFFQDLNSVLVAITAGYSTGTPVTWTLDIPDLTGAGYDPAWGLQTGPAVDWEVFAVSGDVLPFFGATPADGNRILGAFVSSGVNVAVRLERFRRW